MIYFIIAPLFVLWLVTAAIALAATRFITPLRPMFPHVWRMCLWPTIGFIVAVGALMALTMLLIGFDMPLERGTMIDDIVRTVMGLAIGLGPLVAAVIGWLGGLLLGMALAFLRQRRLDAAATAQAPIMPAA